MATLESGFQPSPLKLLTVAQAAELLSVSERTLWSITAPRGTVPAVRIGRLVRYELDDLLLYIRRQKGHTG